MSFNTLKAKCPLLRITLQILFLRLSNAKFMKNTEGGGLHILIHVQTT